MNVLDLVNVLDLGIVPPDSMSMFLYVLTPEGDVRLLMLGWTYRPATSKLEMT